MLLRLVFTVILSMGTQWDFIHFYKVISLYMSRKYVVKIDDSVKIKLDWLIGSQHLLDDIYVKDEAALLSGVNLLRLCISLIFYFN